MGDFCFSDVSYKARGVGTFTMYVSLLVATILVINFFLRKEDEDFFESVRKWEYLLGMNWIHAIKYTQLQNKALAALICFLIYAILFFCASNYLIFASLQFVLWESYIVEKRVLFAVPWLVLQMISEIDQIVALYSDIHDQQTLDLWKTTYLLVNVYFFMVVGKAAKEWYDEENRKIANRNKWWNEYVQSRRNNMK